MAQMVIPNDVRINGTLSCQSVNLPSGAVKDDDIEQATGIKATKVIHQHAIHYGQAAGSDVVSATMPVHTFRGDAEIVAVEVVPLTAPTGGDKEFTVDVQIGNAASAFATVLDEVVTVDSTSVTRTVQEGTVTDTTAEDGDTLQVVVAASGSTGSQGQGFVVTIWVRENPD